MDLKPNKKVFLLPDSDSYTISDLYDNRAAICDFLFFLGSQLGGEYAA